MTIKKSWRDPISPCWRYRCWWRRRHLAAGSGRDALHKKYRRQGVILLAGLAVGVLVGNVCLGAWLVFAAVRRLTRRSRP